MVTPFSLALLFWNAPITFNLLMGPPDCSYGKALLRLISASKGNCRCAALRMPIRLLCDACVYFGPGLQMHIQWLLAKRGLASRIYLPTRMSPSHLESLVMFLPAASAKIIFPGTTNTTSAPPSLA